MILIISDYHKKEEKVLSLISKHKPDLVLCLGDGESKDEFYLDNNIISVKGNCDFANLPLVKVLDYNNKRFLMVHGHLHSVYFDVFKLYMLALEHNADYVLYGHTHIQVVEEYEGVTFVNPGALKDGNYILLNDEEFILK